MTVSEAALRSMASTARGNFSGGSMPERIIRA